MPGESELDIPSDDGPHYTIHLFPDFAKTLQHIAPSGASVWFPAMEEDHSPPSTLLLDFWYGCVALRAWGQDAFRSYCTNEIFGPEGRTVQHPSVNRDNNKKSSDDASVEKEHTRKTTTQGIAGSDMNNILDVMLAFFDAIKYSRKMRPKIKINLRKCPTGTIVEPESWTGNHWHEGILYHFNQFVTPL